MALSIIGSGGGGNSLLVRPSVSIRGTRTTTFLVTAKSGGGGDNKKPSSSTSFKTAGKFGSKNRKTSSTTLQEDDIGLNGKPVQFQGERINDEMIVGVGGVHDEVTAAKLKELPGLEKDFWEGPQWDTFGFFVQYLWAFGIIFGLVACGVAVATYNEGAADFKQTPAYKESIQSRDFLEEPESSSSDIFESNPTEEAPSLE